MKAVILAAGIASRLRPLTDHTPKCLLKVGEKNILSYTMDHLLANDINEIIIVTGYLQEQIRDFIADAYFAVDVKFIYNELYASTNNIYSLWLAKEEVQGQDMLLLDSDILFDQKIITKLLQSGYENCLALKRHEVGEEEIKVKVDMDGLILQIGKDVIPHEAIGESIGIEKFSSPLVDKLYKTLDYKIVLDQKVNIFYEAAFQDLILEGEQIYVVDVTELNCMEIDTAHDFTVAQKMISSITNSN
ncbi:MAG: phosphocholine cytidylyltransferase family protein [Saprospiraceae bacterium]